jgi:PAS domain S-box-containing protein
VASAAGASASVRWHPVQREWFLLTAVLLALAFLLPGSALFWRIDQTLYDESLRLTRAPLAGDVVVIAIDDASLRQIGRWPWRRSVHAALLDRLATANTRAVFLDVMFAEPDPDPAQDVLLAGAMARHRKVVLPVVFESLDGVRRARGPVPTLREAAATVGHINAALDPDGALRRVPLWAGIGSPTIPHVALAIQTLAGTSIAAPGGGSAPAWTSESRFEPIQYSQGWLIPFSSAMPKTYAYADVLSGAVPASALAGQYVLVGLTATGAGDAYVTPLSGGRMAPTPGIEVHAHVLSGQLQQREVVAASRMEIGAVTAFILAVLMWIFLRVTPRMALLATFLAALVTLVGAFLLMFTLQVWVAPTYAIVLIFVAYPLWGWRRLEGAHRYMREEVQRLAQEPVFLPEQLPQRTPHRSFAIDEIERSIEEVRSSTERLRNLKRFIADSFENLPDAVIVADREGAIVMANDRASLYLSRASADLAGHRLAPCLDAALAPNAESWTNLLMPVLQAGEAIGLDARTVDGRELWVRAAPTYSARAQQSGIIVGLTDVTELRAAEARRDEMLKVMTHDMRAPQAAILTLIEMHRVDPAAVDAETVVSKAGRYAEKTLALADGFLKLAKAEAIDPKTLPPVNLVDALLDAADSMWPLASERGIRLTRNIEPDEAWVRGDFDLLTRAITNLLSNAIKYSPANTSITLAMPAATIVDGEWLYKVEVRDQGYGIPADRLANLFARFNRIDESNPERVSGVGLGLAMVKSFVEAHGGTVRVESATSGVARGTCFTILLPRFDETATVA